MLLLQPTFVSMIDGVPEPQVWWVCETPFVALIPSPLAPIGRVWVLDTNTRFDAIPAAERYAARAILRCGFSIMVRGYDGCAVVGVAARLFRMINLDGDGQWCGHG